MIVTVPVADASYAADRSAGVPDRPAPAGIGESVVGRRL